MLVNYYTNKLVLGTALSNVRKYNKKWVVKLHMEMFLPIEVAHGRYFN